VVFSHSLVQCDFNILEILLIIGYLLLGYVVSAVAELHNLLSQSTGLHRDNQSIIGSLTMCME